MNDEQNKSYNGAQPYEGSQREVEPRTNHSSNYSGSYDSRGRYAAELND